MQISELTVRLLLLFFPGILCTFIVRTFTTHKDKSAISFVIQSLFLGFVSYFVYWNGVKIFCFFGKHFKTIQQAFPNSCNNNVFFLRALLDSKSLISYKEICWVTLVAAIFSIFVVIILNYKLHFHLLNYLKITKKFGDLDVWSFALNSSSVEWVTIRDHANNLMYDGWVKAFSDDSKNAEILIRDVQVYKNLSGEHLYDVGAVYLSLDRKDIAMEFRDFEFQSFKTLNKGDKNESTNTAATTANTADTADSSIKNSLG